METSKIEWLERVESRQDVKIKSLKCEHCKMSFESDFHLKNHIRYMHTSKESFNCDICGKEFSTKRHLENHLMKLYMKKRETMLANSTTNHLSKKLP